MTDTITVWMTNENAEQYQLYKHFKTGCENKVAYKSQGGALVARDYVTKRSPLAAVNGTVAYKCRFCGSWHLGHNRRATNG